MSFMMFNYVQIKCNDCQNISDFNPGLQEDPIECQHCKKEREIKKEIANAKRRTKNTKKVQ